MTRRAVRHNASVLELATGVARKDAGAQIAGALARKSGKAFELAIDGVNAWYDQHGDAAIEKVNPPAHGWGASLRLGASTVDYIGTRTLEYDEHTCRRGIAFDAKAITGDATFKAPDAAAGKGRDRKRFFAQVDYLRGLRDRHHYAVGFLLYCSELEVAWWCSGGYLETLAAGLPVPVRDRVRATKRRAAFVTHYLPHLVAPLERSAIPQLTTRRPLLDYLRLIAE